MTCSARILLAWAVFLATILGSQGVKLTIVRAPGNYFCARLSCSHDVSDDVSSVTITKVIIYDTSLAGERIRLASIGQKDPDISIDPNRRDHVNGTGSLSKSHAEIMLDLHRPNDCISGSFQCEVEFENIKGQRDSISENIQPGDQQNDCSCSAITNQFTLLTTRSDAIDISVNSRAQDTTELRADEIALRQNIATRQKEIAKIKQNSDITDAEIRVLQQVGDDVASDIAKLGHDITEAEADSAKLKGHCAARGKDVSDLKASYENKEAQLAVIRQTDSDNTDALSKLKSKDEEFEEDINELKQRDRNSEKEINNLNRNVVVMKTDINSINNDERYLNEDISAIENSDVARNAALNNLVKNDDLIAQQISDLKQSFDKLRGSTRGLLSNDTTFISQISVLQQVDKHTLEASAVLVKQNQFTSEQLDDLEQNNKRSQDTIRDLARNDTNLQRQIDELQGKVSTNQREYERLNQTDVTLTLSIIGLNKTDAALEARWTTLSANYESLEREAISLRREQAVLVQRVMARTQEMIQLQGFLDATQVTTVTRTTTTLRQTTCSRGMAHNEPREPVLLWGSLPTICDTETDGGGWIIIQRRSNGQENFYRPWADYKKGFGHIDSDYWIGNDVLHNLTSLGYTEVRIEVTYNKQSHYAQYSRFVVGNEFSKYLLSVSGYSGTAGDSFSYHNGQRFSTFDSDNDNSQKNCAVDSAGGFWYGDCYEVNLNGRWGKNSSDGLIWKSLSSTNCLYFSEIKVRLQPSVKY